MSGHELAPQDLLVGGAAIGAHIGLPPTAIWHLARTKQLPVIRLGRKLAIRKSRLAEWLVRQEEEAEVRTNGTKG